MGTPALAVPTLEAVAARHDVVAVVTQPDRPSGRGRALTPSPVKAWAVERGIEVLQPRTLREEGIRDRLAAVRPDVAVVVAFGQLLPPDVLAIPPLGCVNLHASLLPRHRGASPIQAAMLAGDDPTGVTTMLMDEGLDTGPILLTREVPIAAEDTAGTLGRRLGEVGAELVVETLAGLRDGSIRPRPQRDEDATMTRLIRKQDGLIDWHVPAEQIERRVRAMQPWPVATLVHGHTPIKVWSARIASGAWPDSEPGRVLESGERLVVACGGDTALELLELQRPGGRRLAVAEFLRGYALPAGGCLVAASGERG